MKIGIDHFPDVMYFRQGDFEVGCGPLFCLVLRYPRKFFCTVVGSLPNVGTDYSEADIKANVECGYWRIV